MTKPIPGHAEAVERAIRMTWAWLDEHPVKATRPPWMSDIIILREEYQRLRRQLKRLTPPANPRVKP